MKRRTDFKTVIRKSLEATLKRYPDMIQTRKSIIGGIMKSKKKRRHILGVGHPFFKKSSVNQSQYTGVFLMKKGDDFRSDVVILKVTGRIGMWRKCRLILEEV